MMQWNLIPYAGWQKFIRQWKSFNTPAAFDYRDEETYMNRICEYCDEETDSDGYCWICDFDE